jgi:2-polyprenyl-6-methoxyphenol hydroxylase-like FAD-dependent oxidoreductase
MGSAHPETIEHETPILIVGAGPIGMLTALELSRLGVDCLLAEKSLETTKWPKMDMTNCRSMEILRLMGLVQDLRLQDGYVNEDSPWDSIFFSSFSPGGEVLTAWVNDPLITKQMSVLTTNLEVIFCKYMA